MDIQDLRVRNQKLESGADLSMGDGLRRSVEDVSADRIWPSTPADAMRALWFDAMFEATAAVKLPEMTGGEFVESGQPDPGIFDNARLAVKQHARTRQDLTDVVSAQLAQGVKLDPVINGMLGIIEDGNSMIGRYDGIMEKVIGYFGKVTDLMNIVANAIKADEDNKHITVSVDAILHGIRNITGDKPDVPTLSNIATGIKVEPATQENIQKWQKELGNAVAIDSAGNVFINVDRLQKMFESVRGREMAWKLDTAAYQAWNSSFSGQKDNIQNDVQTLAEKYARQKSIFDNLVKVLSGTIAALMDTAKGYLQI